MNIRIRLNILLLKITIILLIYLLVRINKQNFINFQELSFHLPINYLQNK